MSFISNEEFDQVFLDVFSDLLSNIVSASEHAANEILDISSNVMSESVQSTLTTFHDIYFSQSADELKYNFNCEIDDILDQVQSGEADLASDEQSEVHKAGEQLANVQKLLEKTISSDKDLKAKIAPIMVGMQFAETTNQHLDRINKSWQEIIMNEHNDSASQTILLEKIEQHISSPIEIDAFYKHVKKQDPPASSEEDLGNWIDDLFD